VSEIQISTLHIKWVIPTKLNSTIIKDKLNQTIGLLRHVTKHDFANVFPKERGKEKSGRSKG
jgi:hypothetical protein